MTDYPSIDPADVREGDVVRGTRTFLNHPSTVEGEVWKEGFGSLFVAGTGVSLMTDLRLVSRPTPPEPPLRVGDWITGEDGLPYQIARIGQLEFQEWVGNHRIEPPVGWPVGVPDGDGGTTWWVMVARSCDYEDPYGNTQSWVNLLRAGGVPALAVTR